MYRPQKLHYISYLNALIKAIKQNFFLILVIFGVNIWNFDFTNIKNYIAPSLVFIFFLVTLINQCLKVYSTRYWIENNRFIVTEGIFNKNRKELNIKRIQSLDTSQNLINQLVKGVKLQIKTPSDGIELETITKEQSIYIEKEIIKKQKELLQTENENKESIIDSNNTYEETNRSNDNHSLKNSDKVIFKMSFQNILLMALTSGAIGVTFAAISPLIGAVQDFIPWDTLTDTVLNWIDSVLTIVIGVIIFTLILSYIIGTVITIIRYYDYQVVQENSQLKISYGLLNVKKVTVPTNRVQAVLEKQSFLRKLFGYTSIYFIITSDFESRSNQEENLNGKVMILPFIKRQEAYIILRDLAPELKFEYINKGMPIRSLHRHFVIPSLLMIDIGSIISYYWSPWIFTLVGLLIILNILHGWFYVKWSGITSALDEIGVSEVSWFNINTFYFKTNKILELEISQNPLMKRSHLATMDYIIAKGSLHQSIKLKFIEFELVKEFRNTYLRGDNGA